MNLQTLLRPRSTLMLLPASRFSHIRLNNQLKKESAVRCLRSSVLRLRWPYWCAPLFSVKCGSKKPYRIQQRLRQ